MTTRKDGLRVDFVPKLPNQAVLIKADGTEIALEEGDKLQIIAHFPTPSSVVRIADGFSEYSSIGISNVVMEKFSLTVSGSTGKLTKSEQVGSSTPRFARSLDTPDSEEK